MARIDLLTATARTASFAFEAEKHLHALPEPVAWALLDDKAHPLAKGTSNTVVFTLCGLEPQTRYQLQMAGGDIEFETARESRLIDIAAFGASPDSTDNTRVIQAAIDALPEHGTLKIPPGLWYSGPLFLKSHMTLFFEDGACLSGLSDRSAYPILPPRHEDGRVLGTWEGVSEACYASLLTAIDCHDINITGAGVIDGGGDRGDWWTWPKETRDGARRPRTIFISGSQAVTLSGIVVRNSPSWTVHPVLSLDVKAIGLTIENDPYSPNTDGLNPECCNDVLLQGIHFSVGDDCIAVKAGKRDPKGGLDQPCEAIRIENCLMERGHGGVVIGSEMSGTVRDVKVRRCQMIETDRGLRIKTRRGRGGLVENISVEDCVMTGVQAPLVINAFYFCDADGRSDYVQSRDALPVTDATPRISGITVRNVVADRVAIAAAAFYGLPEAPVENITIENYRVTFDPHAVADAPDMACHMEPVRHAGIISENAAFLKREGIVLSPNSQSIAV
ncbi:glycoside hydrolase family 28 protein [Agrobacterium sp.]|uniref:polygalacturonase PglA n=1 Tax=Agrobacterium sp. TaxID=361 RepID=UPI0028A89D1B|nr:glycoside hydrolase family 28 protein [Agrobacterium sp.]